MSLLVGLEIVLTLTTFSAARADYSAHRSARAQLRSARLHAVRPQGRAAIVGGQDATQGTWPFMAFVIQFDAAGNAAWLCSATVISPNVVLTAAHCVHEGETGPTLDPSRFGVVTGAVDWSDATNRQVSAVSQVIPYPAYNATQLLGDAALLVLKTPTTASSVRLASASDVALLQPGAPAYIAGWGEAYSGSGVQEVLQWATTGVQSSGVCRAHDAGFSSSALVCALDSPEELATTCRGDSGGPLLASDANNQPVEIGITSFGTTGCPTSTPAYFTRVDQLSVWASGWVAAVTGTPPPPSPPPSTTPAPASSTLPRLALSDAQSFVRTTLRDAFPRSFKHAHRLTLRCSRNTAIRFKCSVRYWSGPDDYYGSVSVFFVKMSGSTVYWGDTFAMNWVNDRCYYHSRHRSNCNVYTSSGSI